MVAILQAIDGGRIGTAIVAHFDRETIFYTRKSRQRDRRLPRS
jgi:hypothetical protein